MKKIDFSKNTKARKIMIIATCCMFFILSAFSSIDVYADGSISLVDFYSMPDSVFDYSSVDNFSDAETVTENNQSVYDWFISNNKLVCSDNSTYLDLSTYPKYIFFGSTNNGKYYFAPMPDDSFILFDNDSFSLYYPNTYFVNGSSARPYFAYFYGSNMSPNGFIGWYNDDMYTDRTLTKDGVTYWQYTITYQSYSYETMLVSNIESYNAPDSTSINGVDFNDNINEDKSVEVKEHMTLRDDTTRFYISNSTFNNGDLYIYAGTDEYQMSSENIANYYLRITGSCNTNCKYDSTGFNAVKYNGSPLEKYFPMSTGSSNQYNFTLNSSSGSYIDIPFVSLSNNEYKISLGQLNGHFTGASGSDNAYSLMAQGFDSSYGSTSVWQAVTNVVGGLTILGYKFDVGNRSNDYNIVPLGVLQHLDLYVYNSATGTLSSVQSTIDFNYVTGSQTTTNVGTSSDDAVMGATGSSYVPSDYVSTNNNTNYGGSLQNGGSSSSSSSPSVSPSISGGDNSVNVNIENNPTFNNDVSSKSESSAGIGSTLLTTILKQIIGTKGSGVDALDDLADSTGWFNIVNQTYTFVPSSFWNLLITCFTVCLGIVVVSFVISMVIKIIT